ncbi:MAG: hypothetical protein R3B93_19975 [Bacteroidia bacterium]
MTQRTSIMLTICLMVFSMSTTFGQQKELTNRANLVFGLGQITMQGFNVEGNIFYKRIAFDYSHGVSLNLANDGLENGADRDQGLSVHIPWTTGFGVGYRFNEWLNLRVEPKWHKFELFYDGQAQIPANLIGDYTTFTLGLGLYGNLRPFKNQDNLLQGIMIVPNVRWWPRVSSSLENNQLTYINRNTDQSTIHEARQIGMGNTPFFANISIGYSVTF